MTRSSRRHRRGYWPERWPHGRRTLPRRFNGTGSLQAGRLRATDPQRLVLHRLLMPTEYAEPMTTNPAARADGKLTVALISEVFWEPDGPSGSGSGWRRPPSAAPTSPSCRSSRSTRGARPRRTPHDDDAEPMDGPRTRHRPRRRARRGSAWSAASSIATRRPGGGRAARSSSTAAAQLLATYEKLHLPEEPGFWETSHYEPGNEAAAADRRLRRPDRRPALLGQQPAGGHAPARRAGRDGDAQPARHRGADLPALEDRVARERVDELLLRAERQPAAPGGGRPDRRPERRDRPERRGLVETTDPMALVTIDAATVVAVRAARIRAICRFGRASTPMPGPRWRRTDG